MAVFEVKSKDSFEIEKKPRVYFTCHPEDYDRYFKSVCDDIFKTQDCAIYYTKDMSEPISPDEIDAELGRNSLFVVPVTHKLLSAPNRAMTTDIPYAKREHIPILPIMMELNLDSEYSKPENFGDLQYLDSLSTDLTQIPYSVKLEKFLKSVLISNNMAKRIADAFDAYIFLSYRKKDRKYANELMRLIHQNPDCRDIAIWFDEFLTPGESFKENIEKMLDDCQLFTLLITPHLLENIIDEDGNERQNYVLSTELPLARKKKKEKGTGIFAVEMEETDKNALYELDIIDFVKCNDIQFKNLLSDSISGIAKKRSDSPEHNFLIGLAYLDGIDVEVDRARGLKLIESAADEGLIEAMKKYFSMLSKNPDMEFDYNKTREWVQTLGGYCVENIDNDFQSSIDSLGDIAFYYHKVGNYQYALELLMRTYEYAREKLGNNNKETLIILGNVASMYSQLGNGQRAIEIQNSVLESYKSILDKDDITIVYAMTNLASYYFNDKKYVKALDIQTQVHEKFCSLSGKNSLDAIYSMNNLAKMHLYSGNKENALQLQKEATDDIVNVLGEYHPTTFKFTSELALCYSISNQHDLCLQTGLKLYDSLCAFYGGNHPETLDAMSNLALYFSNARKHQKSIEIAKSAYEKHSDVLGEEHPKTLMTLKNLAKCYENSEEYKKAIEVAKSALEKYQKVFRSKPYETKALLQILISSLEADGNHKEALSYENMMKKI